MEKNEDEPDDVRKATPVAGTIKSGTKDESAGNPRATKKQKHQDQNSKKCGAIKLEARTARNAKASKMMSVLVYSPPCTLPKVEVVPRHCLSKPKYLDVLATPSRKCSNDCTGRIVMRKVRPLSARINELAQPARRLIMGTLQERGETLPPEMIASLIKSVEGSACMTPEQAEQYFRDKERNRSKDRNNKGGKCGKQKCKGKIKSDCPSPLDREAVLCQYLMAERFVKSILQWKCPIPVDEFQDIALVILRRLSFILEYEPLDGRDLKSQQMRFLADIIACWISGVLVEVAKEHKKELEDEKAAADGDNIKDENKDQDEEDEDEDEAETLGTKEPDEEGDEEDEEEEAEADKKKDVPVKVEDEPLETPAVSQVSGPQTAADGVPEKPGNVVVKEEPGLTAEINKQQEVIAKLQKDLEDREKALKDAEERVREEEERRRKEAEADRAKREEEDKRRKEIQEAEEKEAKAKMAKLEEELKNKIAEEEEARKKRDEEDAERKKKEAEEEKQRKEELEKKKKEEEEKLKTMGPSNAIKNIGDGELFKTDLPFVTFGKIIETFYDMTEDEPEGNEEDLIHNRIQRALYEKFAHLVDLENPESLTENLKDVIDVLAGKVATWMNDILKDAEVKFMSAHPAEVESKEVRDWGKWMDQVTDRAGDWAQWIHRIVKDAENKFTNPEKVNRGDWENWTSDLDTKALLWRRYYLETVHQAHHNKMMIADRPVVKTGGKGEYSYPEEEIQNTDLGA